MNRTVRLALLGVTLAVSCSGPPGVRPAGIDESETEADLVARARTIHDRVLTIDTHDDIEFNFATPAVDPGVRGERQVDLPKMVEGGLDAGFFIVYIPQTARTPEGYEEARVGATEKFEAIHRMAEKMYPDRIEIAYTADAFERIRRAGKLVAAIGIENGYAIGKDLPRLKQYHQLGARYMTLAHNGHNDIADSAQPRSQLGDREAEHGGISAFGRQVIEEMNRLGIMVDVSHISKQAMLDAVKYSRAPIMASHSSTRALCDHPRNMDDEQLLALRANGGVIQMVALGSYVRQDTTERQRALRALRAEFGITPASAPLPAEQQTEYEQRLRVIDETWPAATVKDFVDHIDYAVGLIGIDHVGISSDFDGGGGVVGWNDATETFNVTLELVRRDYREEEISKIWGGNLLRVLREVERVARESAR